LNANRLEIKLQIQRGMTFLDLTLIFFIAAKKLIFYGEKWDSDLSKILYSNFRQKTDFSFQFFNRSLAKSKSALKNLQLLW